MTPVLWIHPYCLSRENPLFRAHPTAPAVFVWDDDEIEAERWTLKRLVFIRECLEDMRVEIRRGDVVLEVRRFATEHSGSKILTIADPSPRIRRYIHELGAEVIAPDPFVDYRGSLDLKRFARYWKRVEPVLFPK